MIPTPDEIEFNTELGRLIRATREKFGMSQHGVATKLGITFQQMQKHESGQTGLSCYRLHKISSVFELSFGSYIGTGLKPLNYRIPETERLRNLVQLARCALGNLEQELI